MYYDIREIWTRGNKTIEAVPEASYRIAVAVEKAESVEQLLRTALDIAHDNGGRYLL